jgi:hypothetical protein
MDTATNSSSTPDYMNSVIWWNNLSESSHKYWLNRVISGKAEDAWVIYKKFIAEDSKRYATHINENEIISVIAIEQYARIEIFGDTKASKYEWRIVKHNEIKEHSDAGYGDSTIALRDALFHVFN